MFPSCDSRKRHPVSVRGMERYLQADYFIVATSAVRVYPSWMEAEAANKVGWIHDGVRRWADPTRKGTSFRQHVCTDGAIQKPGESR